MTNLLYPHCRCTNTADWENAAAKFPKFADEEKLREFCKLNLKSKDGVPQPFRNYCQSALDSINNKTNLPSSVERNGVKAYFLEGSYRNITGQMILKEIATFSGAGLIMVLLSKVSSASCIQSSMYVRTCMYMHTYIRRCTYIHLVATYVCRYVDGLKSGET